MLTTVKNNDQKKKKQRIKCRKKLQKIQKKLRKKKVATLLEKKRNVNTPFTQKFKQILKIKNKRSNQN